MCLMFREKAGGGCQKEQVRLSPDPFKFRLESWRVEWDLVDHVGTWILHRKPLEEGCGGGGGHYKQRLV